MATKKTKPNKKPMTLDGFAVLIQKDLARTATKDDIKAIREETEEDIRVLRNEMRIGFKNLNDDVKMITDTMVSKADLANTLAEELAKSPYARQIADLQDAGRRKRQTSRDLIPLVNGMRGADAPPHRLSRCGPGLCRSGARSH